MRPAFAPPISERTVPICMSSIFAGSRFGKRSRVALRTVARSSWSYASRSPPFLERVTGVRRAEDCLSMRLVCPRTKIQIACEAIYTMLRENDNCNGERGLAPPRYSPTFYISVGLPITSIGYRSRLVVEAKLEVGPRNGPSAQSSDEDSPPETLEGLRRLQRAQLQHHHSSGSS
jgi:hypothetical protein